MSPTTSSPPGTSSAGERDRRVEGGRAGSRLAVAAVWMVAVLVLIGTGFVSDTSTFDPLSPLTSALSQGLVLVLVAVSAATVWLLRGHPSLWPQVVTAATSVLVAAMPLISLAKTPYGLQGVSTDQSIRSVMMQRFSMTASPVDFGYEGHGSASPPLWFWLSGRVGDLLEVPGWEMMKWAQIATAFMVPVVALIFWRRVVGLPPAALVAAVTTLAVPDLVRGDEWLSLVVMLPWWLDAFADVRVAGVRRWPDWLHGMVAGLMLSLHTAFFPSAAVATLMVFAVALRRGTWRTLLPRWLVLVAVGLVVWAWVWVPALYERVTGPAYHNHQLLWFGGVNAVPRPVTVDVVGMVMLIGITALAWSAARRRTFRWLSVFVGAVVVVIVIGLLLTVAGHPILVQKTYLIARHSLVSAAVLGVWQAGRWAVHRFPASSSSLQITALVLVSALATTLGFGYVDDHVRGDDLVTGYNTRLPDGSVSEYAPEPEGERATSDQIAGVLAAQLPGEKAPVVLSHRYDVFVHEGWYSWQQSTETYAHPHSRYRERTGVLEKMDEVTSPQQMHQLVTENGIEPIEALVLVHGDGAYKFDYRVNEFPYGTETTSLSFDPDAFGDPDLFTTTTVGGWRVIVPR